MRLMIQTKFTLDHLGVRKRNYFKKKILEKSRFKETNPNKYQFLKEKLAGEVKRILNKLKE